MDPRKIIPRAWAALDELERLRLPQRAEHQVFTPARVAHWLVRAAAPRQGEVCLDPAAGTGRLLLAALLERVVAGEDPDWLLEHGLVGIERDPRAAQIAAEVLQMAAQELGGSGRVQARVECADALAGPLPQAQVVLMNPPYGNADQLDGETHQRLAGRFGFHRRQLDRAAFFIAAGAQALTEGGRLAAIAPRYWLEATGAAPFRAWLATHSHPRLVLDLGNHQVWHGVEVLTALVVLDKDLRPARPMLFGRPADVPGLWRGPAPDTYPIEPQRLQQDEPWTFQDPAEERWLAQMSASTTPLGSWFQIGQGLKSGLNKAFVMPRAQALQLGWPQRLLKPTVKGRDVRMHQLADRALVLVAALEDDEPTGALLDHLSAHRPALEARYQARKGKCRWHNLSLPQNTALMDAPVKILSPLYARQARFALDRGQHWVSTDLYMMVPDPQLPVPVEAVVTLLGSAPVWRFIQARSKLKRAGYREFGRRLLSSLPLPLGPTPASWPQVAAQAPPGIDGAEPWQALAQCALALEAAQSPDTKITAFIDAAAACLYGVDAKP